MDVLREKEPSRRHILYMTQNMVNKNKSQVGRSDSNLAGKQVYSTAHVN